MPETRWVVDDKKWKPVKGDLVEKIVPGIYELHVSQGGPFGPPDVSLKKMDTIENDRIMPLPGSLAEYIVSCIETFWKKEHLYREMGLIHKRGILLEGSPGTGKTAICLIVGKEIANRGGVAVFTSAGGDIGPLPAILKILREIHPSLAIVNIMEDIDKHRHYVSTLLPMLDGETQISNVVHLATTNYVDKLDDRLTNRPSRFDEVICACGPKKATREAYLKMILPDTTPEKTFNEMVKASQGLNFAHLKELAICTYVYGRPVEKTVQRLKRLAEKAVSGFGKDDEDDKD